MVRAIPPLVTFASAEDARAADPSSALLSRDRYTRHGRQRRPPRRHARRMSQTSSRRALAVALFALIALAAIAECVDAHKTHHKHKHYYKPTLRVVCEMTCDIGSRKLITCYMRPSQP